MEEPGPRIITPLRLTSQILLETSTIQSTIIADPSQNILDCCYSNIYIPEFILLARYVRTSPGNNVRGAVLAVRQYDKNTGSRV